MALKFIRSGQVAPQNRTIIESAQSIRRAITPIAQEQLENSLQVDGHPVMLYQRLFAGAVCSCSYLPKHGYIDENGNADPDSVYQLLSSALSGTPVLNGVIDYHQPKVTGTVFDYSNSSGEPDITAFDGGVTLFDGRTGDAVVTETVIANEAAEPTQVIDYNDESKDLVEGYSLNDFSSSGCACCYGTGFVGGYTLFGGFRKTLAMDGYVTLHNVSRDYSVSPNVWAYNLTDTVDTTGYVTYSVKFPLGAVGVDLYRVMLNNNLSEGVLTIDGSVATPSVILAACDGLAHGVKVTLTDGQSFSHVEFQLNTAQRPLHVEFPRLMDTFNARFVNTVSDVDVTVGPSVSQFNLNDIIVDLTNGFRWRVHQVNSFTDRDRNVYGWECTLRVTQPFELQYLLMVRDKLATNMQATFPRVFKGSRI